MKSVRQKHYDEAIEKLKKHHFEKTKEARGSDFENVEPIVFQNDNRFLTKK